MQFSKDVPFISKALLFLLTAVGGSMAKAQLRSDLRLFSDAYISPNFENSQKTQYQFAGIELKSAPKSEDPVQMDIEGAVAFGAPLLNYLNIRELHSQNKTSETDTLYIGRKKIPWNDLDQRWNLGLWQPVFQWNPLSAEQQGLSGIFWVAERESASITVFGSPLYLPNQGPSFEVSHGAFVEGNPWFRRPPDTVNIYDEPTPVEYSLEKPNESQVVFRSSYGAKVTLGKSDGLLFQLSAMYKPSNDLALGYKSPLSTELLRAQVTLKPQVFFHSVSGADLSHTLGSFRYGVSATLDRPEKDINFEPNWTKPEFHDAVLVSPFVEWKKPSYVLTLQALNIEGGEVTESGPRANPKNPPLSMRFPFQQAVMTSMENRLSLGGVRRLASKLSYTFSDKNAFEFLQWQMRFRWTSVWTLLGELELIRAEDLTVQNQNKIAQFRNLDRFMIGAAYVF